MYLEENGKILVPYQQGYYQFHPLDIKPFRFDIIPYIKSFKIFDELIDLPSNEAEEKQVRLSYDQNFFSIEFGAINYFEPEAVQFE